MESYITVAEAGDSEIVEKRSRFIGRVMPVGDEQAAKEEIARIREKYHDARHNCWCYIIRGGPERYSDDGEPQGTAGLPMLEVFRRGGVVDVCCVVTRYFGGVLLGPGGLARAYAEAAKLALADAGTKEFRLFERMEIDCPYSFLARVKSEIESFGASIENIGYGECVRLIGLLPAGSADAFNKRLADASAGSVTGVITGELYA